MAKRQVKRTRVSKKTVEYTEAFSERKLLLSNKKKPKVNKRATQVLCYESSMKFRL